VAPDCAVCGADTAVSDACPHCGAACCSTHRPPAAHDCPGTEAGTSDGWRLDLDGNEAANATDATGAARPDDRDTGPRRPATALLRPGVGLAILTLLLVVAALGTVAYAGPFDDGIDAAAVATDVEERSDEERVAAGVGATTRDADLAAVARAHSRDMRDRGFVDHVNPDGETPQDRVEATGLDCRVGENVYQTPRGALADSERALADHVVRSWLDSPGHRETLLRERYDRQGVGVAVGADAVYVTQLFC